ncbi:MAG: hypothetical protein ACI88A_000980 [Paraglaciecola sp.]|jgi:hypothetical protein
MLSLARGLKYKVNKSLLPGLKLNLSASITLLKIGNEQQPLFVVDELLVNPELVVEYAHQGGGFINQKTDFYPGVRKPLPADYGDLICQFVASTLPERLALPTSISVTNSLCALSITNQHPATLLPIQRIPHFDTCDRQQWAVLHYLCNADCGGTGFFRHISSGFEAITEDRNKRYQRMLEDDASTKGLPPVKYLDANSALFEQIHSVDAKYNRALIYPSNLLHSGLIRQWQSTDISSSRLTANTFLRLNG